MANSKNDEAVIAFSKSLEMTNELVQKLLEDLHEGEISFIEIRTELKNLILSFHELSKNLKYSDSKIQEITVKIALLDAMVKQLDNKISEREKEKKERDSANSTGKWGLRIAMITGAVSLIVGLVTALAQCFSPK